MIVKNPQAFDLATAALLNRADVQVLSPEEERALVLELDHCKRQLLEARLPRTEEQGVKRAEKMEIQDIVRDLLDVTVTIPLESRHLGAVAARYNEVRTRLAMANLRLVAHVARKYQNRGICSSDLIQEGICGLLRAIDRFDAQRQTRLASYAVWWIRQSLQRAVAAGAYPVQLNPHHLQQLAESRIDQFWERKRGSQSLSRAAADTIHCIHSATRPTVSLNARPFSDHGSCLLSALTAPADEEPTAVDLDDDLGAMIRQLKPREQVVLQLRFGLNGRQCHSLSRVSEMLGVSKERIRQIQDGALKKLRALALARDCREATG